MREDWEVKKFEDVFYLQMGKTPSRDNSYYWNGDYKWATISDIKDSKYIHNTKEKITSEAISDNNMTLITKGTVIMSFKLSIGKVAIVGESMYSNEAIMAFVPKFNNPLSDYIYYYIKGYKWSGGNKAVKGITLNKKSLSKNIILIPPLQTQHQIVEELDCLTSIIDKQKKQLEELDNLAQAIFYDMFGDPIKNEKGWELKKMKDISLSVNYGTSSPSSDNGKYKYLRMNNITTKGTIDLSSIKYIDVSPEDLEKYVVRKGDILFNRTNSKDLVGKTALYTFEEEMIIAGYIIRLRVIESIVLPIFLSSYMNMPYIKKYFRGIAKGAVNQSNINSKQLLSTPVYIPPLPLQQQFASKIEAIEKQKELIKKSIKETEDLFNSRMDYYFN